jgi:hypothetical protein
MFDFNPFREYKEMMKQRRLQEADHNMGMGAGAEADYDSAKEHEKFVKEISDKLESHSTTGEYSDYIQQIGPHNLTGEHVDTILTDIEQERDSAGHNPGTPFNPVHSQLINTLKQSRGYNDEEHGRRIANMEYASEEGEPGSSASREADKRADMEIRLRKDGM